MFEFIEQPIERECLFTNCRCFFVGSIYDNTIVVPLNVRNGRVLIQNGVHLIQHMVERFWIYKVNNLLTAPIARHAFANLKHPVRMRAIRIRIQLNHFWFEPQTKFDVE